MVWSMFLIAGTVRFEVGIYSREEIASLPGFRVNEPGHRLIKIS